MNKILLIFLLIFSLSLHLKTFGSDYRYKNQSSNDSACGYADCNRVPYNDEAYQLIDYNNAALSNQTKIALFNFAQKILDDVLQLGLKTANSVAADPKDKELAATVRHETPIDISFDSNGVGSGKLVKLYQRARKSIETGVAFCDEYSYISALTAMNLILNNSRNMVVYILYGVNFSHQFAAISYPMASWREFVIIDPWLRKCFFFENLAEQMKKAWVHPRGSDSYDCNFIKIIDADQYDPQKHSLHYIARKENATSLGYPSIILCNVPYHGNGYTFDPDQDVIGSIGSERKIIMSKSQAQQLRELKRNLAKMNPYHDNVSPNQ